MSNELFDREQAIQFRLAGEAVEAICQRLKRSEVWFHWYRSRLISPLFGSAIIRK